MVRFRLQKNHCYLSTERERGWRKEYHLGNLSYNADDRDQDMHVERFSGFVTQRAQCREEGEDREARLFHHDG